MGNVFRHIDISILKEDAYYVPSDTFGAIICKDGNAEVSIGEKVYRLERNAIVIYVPFTVIRVLDYSPDWEIIMFEENIEFVFSTLTNISVGKRQAVRAMPCVKAQQEQCERLDRLMQVIIEHDNLIGITPQEELKEMLHDIVKRLMQALCIELIGIYFACTPIDDLPLSRAERIYNSFITSVFMRCDAHRSVAHYAAEQHLSPGHFSAIIREQSGQTALKWIETVTISRIKQYLRKSELSLKEISISMNFPEPSAFGRFFKQHEGMSPSAFRKMHKN